MNDFTSGTVSVGVDVHAASIRLAAARMSCWRSARCPMTTRRSSASLPAGRTLAVAYEAGPTGFGLHRHLRAAGIACDVVAPGLVPVRAGDRVKTDPRVRREVACM